MLLVQMQTIINSSLGFCTQIINLFSVTFFPLYTREKIDTRVSKMAIQNVKSTKH